MTNTQPTGEKEKQQPNSSNQREQQQATAQPNNQPDAEPGSQPLDPRAENFIRYRLAGDSLKDAYYKSSLTRIKRASADSRASVYGRQPEIQARLAYLTLRRADGNTQPETAPALGQNPKPLGATLQKQGKAVAGEEVTPELVKAALVAGLKADKPDASTIKAGIEYLQRRDKALGLDAPDPATVAQWLADDEEARTPDHLRRVLKCLARMYRIDMQQLAAEAAEAAK